MYPFNFYIMPYFDEVLGVHFANSPQSLDYLSFNNFDFNKLFYEGVNYISLQKERELNQGNKLKKFRQKVYETEIMDNAEGKAMLGLYQDRLDKLVQEAEQDRSVTVELVVDIKFVRRMVYRALEVYLKEKYPNLYMTFSFDSDFVPKREKMIIKIHSEEESTQLKDEEEKAKLISATDIELGGFRKVIQLISESQKPLAIHNGFADLLFVNLTLHSSTDTL